MRERGQGGGGYQGRRTALRDKVLAPTTVHQYRQAVRRFLEFCVATGEGFQTEEQLDIVLAEYVEVLYERGEPFDRAVKAVYGLRFDSPRRTAHMPETHMRLKAWRREHPCNSHPPLTWQVSVAIAVTMAKWGSVAEGVATLLMFEAYLPISEATNLLVRDIGIPGDPRCPLNVVVVRLGKAKGGREQSVTLEKDGAVSEIMLRWIKRRQETTSVFTFTPASYRHLFKKVCQALGIDGQGFTPHSLRHGGATRDYNQGKSFEYIRQRGRWRSSDSAQL
jgi:integrase